MTDRLAPPEYRVLAPRASLSGDGDSLNNIVTDPLPDGAVCFVIAEREAYRLDKTSTATADGTNIIAPIGGPGRWFRGGGTGGGNQTAQILKTASQSIPDGLVDTALTFDTDSFQTGTLVEADAANDRIIARSTGVHLIVHAIQWDGNGAVTERRSRATQNGSPFEPIAFAPGGTSSIEGSYTQLLNVAAANANIGVVAEQDGVGAGLNVGGARLFVVKLT